MSDTTPPVLLGKLTWQVGDAAYVSDIVHFDNERSRILIRVIGSEQLQALAQWFKRVHEGLTWDYKRLCHALYEHHLWSVVGCWPCSTSPMLSFTWDAGGIATVQADGHDRIPWTGVVVELSGDIMVSISSRPEYAPSETEQVLLSEAEADAISEELYQAGNVLGQAYADGRSPTPEEHERLAAAEDAWRSLQEKQEKNDD